MLIDFMMIRTLSSEAWYDFFINKSISEGVKFVILGCSLFM